MFCERTGLGRQELAHHDRRAVFISEVLGRRIDVSGSLKMGNSLKKGLFGMLARFAMACGLLFLGLIFVIAGYFYWWDCCWEPNEHHLREWVRKQSGYRVPASANTVYFKNHWGSGVVEGPSHLEKPGSFCLVLQLPPHELNNLMKHQFYETVVGSIDGCQKQKRSIRRWRRL